MIAVNKRNIITLYSAEKRRDTEKRLRGCNDVTTIFRDKEDDIASRLSLNPKAIETNVLANERERERKGGGVFSCRLLLHREIRNGSDYLRCYFVDCFPPRGIPCVRAERRPRSKRARIYNRRSIVNVYDDAAGSGYRRLRYRYTSRERLEGQL